jgi:hypothetical protein
MSNNVEWKTGDILSSDNSGSMESLVEIIGYNINLECIVKYIISNETKVIDPELLENPLNYGIIIKKHRRDTYA